MNDMMAWQQIKRHDGSESMTIQFRSLKTLKFAKVKYLYSSQLPTEICELCIMECFLIKYLQIGNAAINRRDECLCKMKELFTSIRRTMRCVIVLQVTTHQRHNYTKGGQWVCCAVLRAAGGEVVTRLAEVESGVRGAGAGTHWHWNTGTCCWVHRSSDTRHNIIRG